MLTKTNFFIKFMIVIVSIIPTLINTQNQEATVFIFFILLYFLNVRFRKIISNRAFVITSLLLDIVVIYLIFDRFSGLTYLLILITIMDGLLYVESYIHGLILVDSFFIMYLLKDKELENILLVALAICCVVFFVLKVKSKDKKLSEIEYLYDDVRRYSYELEKAKKQVELYSNKVEELTQMQERDRISREIHDTIGHRLTALLLQMEAGLRLFEIDNDKSKELLQASLENLRESIDVLRETVRSIKPKEHKNIIFSLKEMINKFKKDTSINATLNVNGNPIDLYPRVELVLYKNIQEALTNAVRHGKASNIIVSLSYGEKEVIATIVNDGNASKDIKKGLGITGMEERLSFIGGRLNIYTDNSFTVENIIPIKGA